MYTLEISEEQAKVIVKALDLFSRLHLGQIEEIAHLFGGQFLTGNVSYHEFYEAAHYMKKCLFPEMGPAGMNYITASYGITSEEVPENARVAYDVLQVVNKQLLRDFPRKGFSFDQDVFQTAKEDLPKISKKEE